MSRSSQAPAFDLALREGKQRFSLRIQPSVRLARFHTGGPHTALETKQLGVRIKCEAMPAHTVKKSHSSC